MKDKIKARLIHMLGGYTEEEYEREARFRPEPEIVERRLYTAVCRANVFISKKAWDFRKDTETELKAIRNYLIEKLAVEIAQYAEFSGPGISDPFNYVFSTKIKVVKPEEGGEPE